MEQDQKPEKVTARETESDRQKLSERLVLGLKKMEIRMRYGEKSSAFFRAARTYSDLAGISDWKVPEEIPDPGLSQDLWLLKRLNRINFGGIKDNPPDSLTSAIRQLWALDTLDYCHNIHRMTKRVGLLSEINLKEVNESARSAVSKAVNKLVKLAYNADPLPEDKFGPDIFSRPCVVFITPEDRSKIDSRRWDGKAFNDAKLALVVVDPKRHIKRTRNRFGVFIQANIPTLIHTSIHELSHLARSELKTKYYQNLFNPFEKGSRLQNNLEEGSTELLASVASKQLDPPENPVMWSLDTPYTYSLAAARISTGLIPRLAKIIRDTVNPEIPDKRENSSLMETIAARFELGDYGLLFQFAQVAYDENRFARFTRGLMKPRTGPNTSALDLLRHPDVFGHSYIMDNQFYQTIDPEDPDTEYSHDVSLDNGDPIPLPLVCGSSPPLPLKPDYTYEIFDNESRRWNPCNPIDLRFTVGMNVRVNYLNVYSDFEQSKIQMFLTGKTR